MSNGNYNRAKHAKELSQRDNNHQIKQDRKAPNALAFSAYCLAKGFDPFVSKSTPRKKAVATVVGLALAGAGAFGLYAATKKSTHEIVNNPVVVWNNTTTEVPIYHNTTNIVYTPQSALISGSASLMKVLPGLNESERNQAFANLTSMYPELKLSNGTPVTNTSQALSSLLDCNGENDYLNGVIVYTVPEKNETIPGMNGSFAIKVKNGTVEKNITTELNNSLAKKIYDLALSTKNDPVEWTGSGQTPSYLAGITDLVQLKKEINSMKGNFTNSYINATNPADSDKINKIMETVPALADLINQSCMGNISGWDFIDTPDDAVGTPNGGGSVVIAYDNQSRIVGTYILDKESTATYMKEIIQAGGTRSSKNIEATVDDVKTQKERTREKYGKTKAQEKRQNYLRTAAYKETIEEMSKSGINKVYCGKDFIAGHDTDGNLAFYTVGSNGKVNKRL